MGKARGFKKNISMNKEAKRTVIQMLREMFAGLDIRAYDITCPYHGLRLTIGKHSLNAVVKMSDGSEIDGIPYETDDKIKKVYLDGKAIFDNGQRRNGWLENLSLGAELVIWCWPKYGSVLVFPADEYRTFFCYTEQPLIQKLPKSYNATPMRKKTSRITIVEKPALFGGYVKKTRVPMEYYTAFVKVPLIDVLSEPGLVLFRRLNVYDRSQSLPFNPTECVPQAELESLIESFTKDPFRRDGDLYFLFQMELNAIKIGRGNTLARKKAGETWVPGTLKILGVIEKGYSMEPAIHEMFKQHHIAREWFRAAPEILEFIAKHTTLPGTLRNAV